METIEYKASMDTLAKFLTVGVVILFIYIGRGSVKTLWHVNEIDKTTVLLHSGILLFLIASIVGTYLYSPKGYAVRNGSIIIKRPIGEVTLNMSDIAEVRKIENGEMNGTIRTFGVGGLFGYYGKFRNSTFGNMTYYVSQRKNMILLKTVAGKKIILSPDNIGMAEKLNELLSLK
jgi:hypothetical protein